MKCIIMLSMFNQLISWERKEIKNGKEKEENNKQWVT